MPYVKALGSENDAQVVVFHADQLLMSRGGGQHQDADEHGTREKVQAQAQQLAEAGVSARDEVIHVAVGESSAQTIAQAANEMNCDLIVVGTRGHTQLGGLLVGSTTTRLLQISPCPIFVVPTAAADQPGQRAAATAEAAG
jgi:nucleotide-binding universal stress UspA family protein